MGVRKEFDVSVVIVEGAQRGFKPAAGLSSLRERPALRHQTLLPHDHPFRLSLCFGGQTMDDTPRVRWPGARLD